MQTNKHGIPIAQQSKKQHFKTFKPHPDFRKYKVFVTMVGYEDGCQVIIICPLAHPDFKKLKKAGYQVIEKWTRS